MKKVVSPSPVQILKRNGRLNIVGMGAWSSTGATHTIYAHHFLALLALIALGYFVANSLFALAYLGRELHRERPTW